MPRRDLERGGHMPGAPIEHRPPPPPGGGAGSQGYDGPDAAALRDELLLLADKWQSAAVDYHRQGDEIGIAYDDCSDSLRSVLVKHGLVQP